MADKIVLYLVIVVLWQIGGQFFKAARRFGIPLATLGYYWREKAKQDGWRKAIAVTTLALVLSMGYGENSKLMKVFKKEWLVRLVYSVLLWIPVAFMFWHSWVSLIGLASIVGVFQLRLGAFKIGKYDFLYEDWARASALWLAIII